MEPQRRDQDSSTTRASVCGITRGVRLSPRGDHRTAARLRAPTAGPGMVSVLYRSDTNDTPAFFGASRHKNGFRNHSAPQTAGDASKSWAIPSRTMPYGGSPRTAVPHSSGRRGRIPGRGRGRPRLRSSRSPAPPRAAALRSRRRRPGTPCTPRPGSYLK